MTLRTVRLLFSLSFQNAFADMSMLARLEEPDKVPCHSARKETSFIRKVILCVPEPFLRYTSVVTRSFSFLGRHQFKFRSHFQTLNLF